MGIGDWGLGPIPMIIYLKFNHYLIKKLNNKNNLFYKNGTRKRKNKRYNS